MAHTRGLTIRLSEEALAFVRSKVESGEYASEEDLVRERIEALQQEDQELKQWEREVVGPAYDRFMADPSSGIPLEEVERRLAEKRRARAEASNAI